MSNIPTAHNSAKAGDEDSDVFAPFFASVS